jgi:hypothetical protein
MSDRQPAFALGYGCRGCQCQHAPPPNASFFPASIRTKRLTEENKDNEEVFKIIGKKSSFPSLSSVKVF